MRGASRTELRLAAIPYEESRRLYARGEFDAAIAAAREAIARNRTHPNALNFAGWIQLSRSDRNDEHLAEAIALFSYALAQDVGNGPARSNLADALVASGRADDAVALQERAIADGQALIQAHHWLGYYFSMRVANPGPALAHLREAVALAPTWAVAWRSLGRALAQANALPAALAAPLHSLP